MMIKFSATLLATLVTANVCAATVDLRILETTDLHSNMMDFDYYKDAPTEKFGLVRTATLINAARGEATNSVLVDNGDLIQGSPLGDYMAAKGLKDGDVHPVFAAMNTLDYAVGNLGNHEFNYGLDYLHKALAGANYPYVNANVIDAKTQKPLFKPWLIKPTEVKDRDGKTHTLKIGYIGFVPPQIMTWDKANLSGKVTVTDITETARRYIPQMRASGADLVVVVAHSGLSAEPYKALAENSVYYLSQVPGVDAILFGHAHAVFPGKDFAAMHRVDAGEDEVDSVLQGDPEARHPRIRNRQAVGPPGDEPPEHGDHTATRPDDVAIAHHREPGAVAAAQMIGGDEYLVRGQLAGAIEIDRIRGLVGRQGNHPFDAAMDGGLHDVFGAINVGVDALEGVVFGDRYLFQRRGMHHVIDVAHRHGQSIAVAHVTDEIADGWEFVRP